MAASLGPNQPPAPTPNRNPVLIVVGILAALVLLLGAGVTVAVALLARGDDTDDPGTARPGVTEADRESAVAFARSAVPIMLDYSWRTFDADVLSAKALMTPAQGAQYDETTASIRNRVLSDRVTSEAEVREVGLAGIDLRSARVLVFADQRTTVASRDSEVAAQPVLLHLTRSDDAWLIDDVRLAAAADQEPREADPVRREVLDAATAFTTAFLNVDHRTVDEATAGIVDLATGGFRDLYAAGLDDLRRITREHRTTLTGEVWATGLVDLAGDRAVVVAATSGTATSAATGGEAQERNYRLRLTLDRVGDAWLASDLQYVTAGP